MANPYVYVILGIFLIALVGGGLFLLMALGVLPSSFLGAVQRLGGQLGGAVSNVVFTQPPGGVNSKGQLLFNGTPPGYGNPNGYPAPYSVELVGINFCYPYDSGYLWLEPNHTYTFNVTLYATYGRAAGAPRYGTTVPVVLTPVVDEMSGLNVSLVPNEGQLPFNATLVITVGPRIVYPQGFIPAYYPSYGYVLMTPFFIISTPTDPNVSAYWLADTGSLTLRIAPQYVYFQNGTPVTATPGLP
ncbi:MAG: hypothetical protein RXS42_09400 [Nitrososphaeria archaeon]